MKVEREELDGNQIRLHIEVETEKVDEALEKAYRKVVRDVKLPGFRKGKVPRQVLEARLGEEVLYQDAIEIMVPEVLGAALQEEEIKPIDQPELEDVDFQKGQPAKLQVLVEVEPEVKLGEYTSLGIEKQEVNIEEKDIEEVLDNYRQQQATLVDSEREEVQEGDFVVIDFEGFLDGEPFDGGKGEDYTLEIGSNSFIPGFEEQLIGGKTEEEKQVTVTFPEEYPEEKLAGQEAVFTVKIKEIKEKELPPVDDELAKTAGDFETLDELKEDVENNMREKAEQETQVQFENEVLEAVSENVEVDIPEKLTEQRLEEMYREVSTNVQKQGFKMEDYLEATGSSKEEWMEQNRPYAEKQVRNRLILDAVASKEGFEVTEEEIEKEIDEIASESQQDPEQFKALLKAQGYDEMIKGDILRKKALDFLLEENKKDDGGTE